MLAHRVIILIALIVATAGIAVAQTRTATTSWLLSAQTYLGDHGLQQELDLSDEQVRRANQLADGALVRYRDSIGASDKDRTKLDEAIRKDLTGFLKEEQMTRLRQVILQNMVSNAFLGAAALANDLDAVKQLKLSEDQLRRLRDRKPLNEVLDAEQKATWETMIGKPYTAPLRMGTSPRPAGPQPSAVQYLAASSVQKELKLSEKQQQQVAGLKEKYTRSRNLKLSEIEAEADNHLREILEPAQLKRLGQIRLQHETIRDDLLSVLQHPRVVESLKLTEDQQKKLATTDEKRRKEMLKILIADEEPEQVVEKVKAFQKETPKILNALLDEEQQSALKDLIGEPFFGPVAVARGSLSRPMATLFVYGNGMAYLGSPDLHKALELNAARAKKLAALAEKATGAPRGDEKSRKELAEANRKQVSAILSEAQMRRFEQVYLQAVVARRIGIGTTIHRYAEVREALNLTAEQIAQVQTGEPIEKVLDESQTKAWKQLLGNPFPGTLKADRSGPSDPLLVLTAASPDVIKELKLTSDQQKKVAEAEKKYRQVVAALNPGQYEKYQQQMNAAVNAFGQEIGKQFTEAQRTRMQQILLQEVQKQGMGALIYEPTVLTAVRLDEEQQEDVLAIIKGYENLRNLLSAEYGHGRPDGPAEGYEKAVETLGKNMDKRLEELLIPQQHRALKKLLGEPFKGEIRK